MAFHLQGGVNSSSLEVFAALALSEEVCTGGMLAGGWRQGFRQFGHLELTF